MCVCVCVCVVVVVVIVHWHCSTQLSMFNMEKRYRNKIIIMINRSKVCSNKLKDRECNPVFVTVDTSCKLLAKRDNML